MYPAKPPRHEPSNEASNAFQLESNGADHPPKEDASYLHLHERLRKFPLGDGGSASDSMVEMT